MIRNVWIYLKCIVFINTGKSHFCTESCTNFTSTHFVDPSSQSAVHNYGIFHNPTCGTRTAITKLWRFKFKTKSFYCCTRRQPMGMQLFSVIQDCPDFMGFKEYCPDVQQNSVYDARCLRVVLPNHKNRIFLTGLTNIFEFFTVGETFCRSKSVMNQTVTGKSSRGKGSCVDEWLRTAKG
jgi:Casein kinase II, beta subunit